MEKHCTENTDFSLSSDFDEYGKFSKHILFLTHLVSCFIRAVMALSQPGHSICKCLVTCGLTDVSLNPWNQRIMLKSMITFWAVDEISHASHKSLRFQRDCSELSPPALWNIASSRTQKRCLVVSWLSSWTLASIKNGHMLTKMCSVSTRHIKFVIFISP